MERHTTELNTLSEIVDAIESLIVQGETNYRDFIHAKMQAIEHCTDYMLNLLSAKLPKCFVSLTTKTPVYLQGMPLKVDKGASFQFCRRLNILYPHFLYYMNAYQSMAIKPVVYHVNLRPQLTCLYLCMVVSLVNQTPSIIEAGETTIEKAFVCYGCSWYSEMPEHIKSVKLKDMNHIQIIDFLWWMLDNEKYVYPSLDCLFACLFLETRISEYVFKYQQLDIPEEYKKFFIHFMTREEIKDVEMMQTQKSMGIKLDKGNYRSYIPSDLEIKTSNFFSASSCFLRLFSHAFMNVKSNAYMINEFLTDYGINSKQVLEIANSIQMNDEKRFCDWFKVYVEFQKNNSKQRLVDHYYLTKEITKELVPSGLRDLIHDTSMHAGDFTSLFLISEFDEEELKKRCTRLMRNDYFDLAIYIERVLEDLSLEDSINAFKKKTSTRTRCIKGPTLIFCLFFMHMVSQNYLPVKTGQNNSNVSKGFVETFFKTPLTIKERVDHPFFLYTGNFCLIVDGPKLYWLYNHPFLTLTVFFNLLCKSKSVTLHTYERFIETIGKTNGIFSFT